MNVKLPSGIWIRISRSIKALSRLTRGSKCKHYLEAKEKGLIDEIKPLLIALRQNGMHLKGSLIAYALREAGEM